MRRSLYNNQHSNDLARPATSKTKTHTHSLHEDPNKKCTLLARNVIKRNFLFQKYLKVQHFPLTIKTIIFPEKCISHMTWILANHKKTYISIVITYLFCIHFASYPPVIIIHGNYFFFYLTILTTGLCKKQVMLLFTLQQIKRVMHNLWPRLELQAYFVIQV